MSRRKVMTRRKALTAVAALSLASIVSALSWRSPAPAERPGTKALERALERAQRELEQETQIWVDHSKWETAWEIETGHYVVRTTHSRRLGLDVAQGLEDMLGHFQQILQTDRAPTERFKIWIFPTLNEYNAFGDEFGADHSSLRGTFYSTDHPERPVAVNYTYNWKLLKMFATHGALHQFLAFAFQNEPPTWVSEGLASYFELYWDEDWGKQQIREMRAQRRMFPVQDLVGAAINQYADRPDDRFLQLGMLFTYLLHYREDTAFQPAADGRMKSTFADYLVGHLRGADVTGYPFHAYMTRDRSRLELELAAFTFE